MVPVMRSAAGPGLLPALLPCPALRITPPRCAKRPALPVSRAVSGRAVANDIFGGCGTGVKPWCDRLMQAGDLTPVVQVGGPAPFAGPAPSPRRDGVPAAEIAALPAHHGGGSEQHRPTPRDSPPLTSSQRA